MINKAHDDWVTGLVLVPGYNHLLSGCRGGVLKVWNIDNCSLVGEVNAHNSPVNALTANSQLLFAASKYDLPLYSVHRFTTAYMSDQLHRATAGCGVLPKLRSLLSGCGI